MGGSLSYCLDKEDTYIERCEIENSNLAGQRISRNMHGDERQIIVVIDDMSVFESQMRMQVEQPEY